MTLGRGFSEANLEYADRISQTLFEEFAVQKIKHGLFSKTADVRFKDKRSIDENVHSIF